MRAMVASAALVAMLTACGPAAADTLPVADGPARCAAAPMQRDMWDDLAEGVICHVVAFGQVAGAVPPMFFQLQKFAPPGAEAAEQGGAGAVLFIPSPDGRSLVTLGGWSGDGAVVDVPRMVQTRQGRILLLPMRATVSSHPNDDVVFRVVHRRWEEVSTQGWLAGVHPPSGTLQTHGNAMDWAGLRAFGAFWRPRDAECCATGGSYIARLRLDGTRLRLVGVRYSRGMLPFP